MKKEQSLMPGLFGSDERNLTAVSEAIQRVAAAKSLEEVGTKDLIIVIALHFWEQLYGVRKQFRSLKIVLCVMAGTLCLNAIVQIIALIKM